MKKMKEMRKMKRKIGGLSYMGRNHVLEEY